MKRHHLIFILSVLFIQYGTAQKNSEKYFELEPLSPDSLSIDSSGYPYVRELNESHPMMSSLLRATTESLHDHIPTSYQIDRSRGVGEISFSTSVTPTGAMTLNVPITVAEDPKGYSPKVSLFYNSAGGNGQVGQGWNISGLSSISKNNKTIYYDGITDAQGAFALDGNRLIEISKDGYKITYKTERGNTKVIGHIASGSSSLTIVYFEVFYPDGSRAIMGYPQSLDPINQGVLSFPITKIYNQNGDSISYSYTKTSFLYQPTKITYGQNGQFSIEFAYTSPREDVQIQYLLGKAVSMDYLLSSISTKSNGNEIGNYSLNYELIRTSSVLKSINYSASGTTLNPLLFYYGDNKQVHAYQKKDSQMMRWYNFTKAHELRVAKGKFDYGTDNDGLITLPNKRSYIETRPVGSSYIFLGSEYKGTESIFISTGLSGSLANFCPELMTESGFMDIFCMDLDDIPGEEIIKINSSLSSTSETIQFHVYTSNPYNGISKKYTRSFNFPIFHPNSGATSCRLPKRFYPGDFDGDGKMEILVVTIANPLGSGLRSEFYLLDLENNTELFRCYPFNFNVIFPRNGSGYKSDQDAYNQSDKLYVLDYDGDGKSDLCHINSIGATRYTFSKTGTSYSINGSSTFTGLKKEMLKDRVFMVGELNGDGKTDFVLSPLINNGNTWTFYLSDGLAGFVGKTAYITERKESSTFILQDMNGDGQSDLVHSFADYNKTRIINTYLIANGRSNIYTYLSTSAPEEAIIIPTNILSQNYFHQLICIKDGIASRIAYQYNQFKSTLLTGVVNSFGAITQTHYQQLNEGTPENPCFNPGSGAIFPHMNFNGGFHVAESVKTFYNGNVKASAHYSYYNAIVHKQGLGFRGFQIVNEHNGITDENTSQTYDPLNFNILKKSESPRAVVSFNYDVIVAANKTAKIMLKNKSEKDVVKDITLASTYTYDSYGNPTKEVIDYGGELSKTTDIVYTNSDNETLYKLGELSSQTTKFLRGVRSVVQKVAFTYNANGNPISKKSFFQNNQTLAEFMVYDNKGNKTQHKEVRLASTDTLVNKYTYDSQGRVTRHTDPLGIYTNFEYNTKGLLSIAKDSKAQQTIYEYDGLGRKIKTTYPDQVSESVSLAWVSTPSDALICATTTKTGKPTSQIFSDAFGREVRTGEMRFNGQYLYVDSKYDSRGRLQEKSLPFKGTIPSLWNVYTYDTFDRITNIQYASGKTDTYSYDQNKVTETSDGVTKTTTRNSANEIVSVQDPAGTITYKLRPDSQIDTIVAPGGVLTTIAYDVYGRQTKLTDPSGGIISYVYNAYGQIGQQTDANGKVTKDTYDKYGRLRKRELVSEMTIGYKYNSDGLLVADSCSNGTRTDYSYDNLRRLLTTRETAVDGKWLQQTYSYSGGNVASIEYSANSGTIVTENYIYSNGTLSEIKLNNSVSIWKIVQENGIGMISNAISGPLTRTYGYNSFGMPTQRKTVLTNGGSVVQNVGYGFNTTTHNLSYRIDSTRNIRENFSYDNLNRLTEFNGNAISYDIKGNIISHSGVGQFAYNLSNKPYAVSDITGLTGAIPLREQKVTYNGLARPTSIIENGITATLVYNGKGDRVKMDVFNNGVNELTRYYIGGCYEYETGVAGTKERLYLGGDAYSAAAVYVKDGNGAWTVNYICRDYLGSITHITNSAGAVRQELSYDAWGRLRNPINQTLYAVGAEPALILGRGYTGHEHLLMFGLINMNARLYDPIVGRFLSPDPYVQAPDWSQNFNRYAYAMNNPFRYTDESGEFIIIIGIAAVAGMYAGGVIANNGEFNPLNWDYSSASTWGGMFGGLIVGGVSGVFGLAVGTTVAGSAFVSGLGGFSAGAITGAAAGAAGGFISGFGMGAIAGGDFEDCLLSGLTGAAIGGAIGGFVGGTLQGIASAKAGNNFWTGKPYSTVQAPSPELSNKEIKLPPWKKGQQGVEKAIQEEVISKGGKILHAEVSVKVNGKMVRVDFAADLNNGKVTLFEIKNGPYARLTPNQKLAYPLMKGENPIPIIPKGENANFFKIDGFWKVGSSTNTYEFKIIHYNKY